MPLVPEAERLIALERLGLSPPLRGVASGQDVPEGLDYTCGPVYRVYAAGDRTDGFSPPGFVTLPLWERGTLVTAVRRDVDGLAFFSYNLEDDPAEVDVIARTEQGLWAHLFVTLIEAEGDKLPTLAHELGFRFLPLVEERYDAAEHGSFEQHGAFLRALTAEIDALEGSRRPDEPR